jgi:hypothetical protein
VENITKIYIFFEGMGEAALILYRDNTNRRSFFIMEYVVQLEGTVYEEGYGMVAKKVMRDKELTVQAKAIYAYLCTYAGSKDMTQREAFPGVSLMKHELGIKSDDTYYKHRNQLVKKGYLKIDQVRGEGSKFAKCIYKIMAIAQPVPDGESEEEPKKPEDKGNEPYPKNSSTGEKPTPKKSSSEKSSSENRSSENWGTNITSSFTTSSFITSFIKIDDDEEENRRMNAKYSLVIEFLKNKEMNDSEIIRSIMRFEQIKISDDFTKAQLESAYNNVAKEILSGKMVTSVGAYFAGAVEKIHEKNKMVKNKKDVQKKDDKKIKRPDFNYLEQDTKKDDLYW